MYNNWRNFNLPQVGVVGELVLGGQLPNKLFQYSVSRHLHLYLTQSSSQLAQYTNSLGNGYGYSKVKGIKFIWRNYGDTCGISPNCQTLKQLFESLYTSNHRSSASI